MPTQAGMDARVLAHGKVQNTTKQFLPLLVDSQGRLLISGGTGGDALEATSQLIKTQTDKLGDAGIGLAKIEGDITTILGSVGSSSAIATLATVTTYSDTTHFKATGLIGLGNSYFFATARPWYVYVQWDAGGSGAAPQGEYQPVLAFTSADGTVQHTAFTTPVAVNDKVLLIHPALAYMLGFTPARAGYLDNLSGGAVAQQATLTALNNISTGQVNTEVDTGLSDIDLDHLAHVTDGAGNYPNTVIDGSILSKILSKDPGGDTSDYDETTDSLEAISDKVTAIPTADAANTEVETTSLNIGGGTVTSTSRAGKLLRAIVDFFGSFTRSFKTQWGTRWDSSGDLGTDIATLLAWAAANPNICPTGTFTTNSATVPADTGRTEATGAFVPFYIIPTSGAYALQMCAIVDSFNGTGKVFTLRTAFANAPGLVNYVLIPRADDALFRDATNGLAAIKGALISQGTTDFNATAKTSIQTADDAALTADNLDHISKVTDGGGPNLLTPVDGSVISKLASKVSGGDTSSFDNTTDSLEAISDKVDVVTAAVGSNLIISSTLTTGSSASTVTDTAMIGVIGVTINPIGWYLRPRAGAAAGDAQKIASYVAGTGEMIPERAFIAAPGAVAYDLIFCKSDGKQAQKDIWCAAPTNTGVINQAAAEIATFPNVVVAAQGAVGGLPLGAIVDEAYLLMMFDLLDTSAAANYVKTAGDGVFFKISTETHYAHLQAWVSVAGDWYTPASGMSSQVVIGTVNLVNATYGVTATGAGTYNIISPETTETIAKAIEAQGSGMTMKNLKTGIRFFYHMP